MRQSNSRDEWLFLKIDLEKAYDKLEWRFALDSLMLAGFP